MVLAPQHVNGSSKYIYSGIKSPLLRNNVVKNNPRTHPLSLDPQDCIKQNKAHKKTQSNSKAKQEEGDTPFINTPLGNGCWDYAKTLKTKCCTIFEMKNNRSVHYNSQ